MVPKHWPLNQRLTTIAHLANQDDIRLQHYKIKSIRIHPFLLATISQPYHARASRISYQCLAHGRQVPDQRGWLGWRRTFGLDSDSAVFGPGQHELLPESRRQRVLNAPVCAGMSKMIVVLLDYWPGQVESLSCLMTRLYLKSMAWQWESLFVASLVLGMNFILQTHRQTYTSACSSIQGAKNRCKSLSNTFHLRSQRICCCCPIMSHPKESLDGGHGSTIVHSL